MTALVCGWWVVPFVGAAIAGTTAVAVLAVRKIGGVAGDVLGTVEQIVECLVMIVRDRARRPPFDLVAVTLRPVPPRGGPARTVTRRRSTATRRPDPRRPR